VGRDGQPRSSGYLRYAKPSSRRRQRCKTPFAATRRFDHGHADFLFSFTSDEFDIYLVNDFLRSGGGG